MIYCVVPEVLEDELFDKLTGYYSDDPNVEVIVDRRKSERRERRAPQPAGDDAPRRETRDRRRPRVAGDFPRIDR